MESIESGGDRVRRPAESHSDADNPASDVLGSGVRALVIPVQDVLARPIHHGQNASASQPGSSVTPPLHRPARLRLVEPLDAETGA
jgi:hypothetical protein